MASKEEGYERRRRSATKRRLIQVALIVVIFAFILGGWVLAGLVGIVIAVATTAYVRSKEASGS